MRARPGVARCRVPGAQVVQLNGELLVAGGGQVLRLALIESQGISSDDLTPELIAENIDKVLDTTDAKS
jgi:hypothetical protein